MDDILMGVPRDCCVVVFACFIILKVTVSRYGGSDTRTVCLLSVVQIRSGKPAIATHPGTHSLP
ncbi:hypothetical protein D3C78_1842970 [compost metagenome]